MRRREFILGLGSAAARPLVAHAQQRAVPVIGYINAGTEEATRPLAAAFRRGLGEFGYIEGKNVELLYRWGEARYERLPALAMDLVQHRVDVIVATGGSATARCQVGHFNDSHCVYVIRRPGRTWPRIEHKAPRRQHDRDYFSAVRDDAKTP